MKSVYINYSKRKGLLSPSWTFFLLGALMLMILSVSIQQIKAQNAELESNLSLRTKPSITNVIVDNPHTKKEAEAVKQAINEIVIPWASLWKAFENNSIEGVGMLTLEPDAKTHMVRIKMIAINHSLMWEYLQDLNQQHNLRNVRLVSSDSTEVNGQHVVSFSVEATW